MNCTSTAMTRMNDGLQVAQVSGVQNEDLDGGKVTAVATSITKITAPDIPMGGIQLLGKRQEQADTVELHQHVVVHQDHAEEDRSKFDNILFCLLLQVVEVAAQLLRSMRKHPACLPARHSRPSSTP